MLSGHPRLLPEFEKLLPAIVIMVSWWMVDYCA